MTESPDTPCRILLIGMMGSGKSTVGSRLSRATGWTYLDNDALVARVRGASARQLLTTRGEGDLRRAEAEALNIGLEEATPCIIGAAAGTVLDPSQRRAMRDRAFVVWLDADAATLASRAVGAAHRPWLDGDPEAWMRETRAAREALYREIAAMRIDTTTREPGEAADAILGRLRAVADCGTGTKETAR